VTLPSQLRSAAERAALWSLSTSRVQVPTMDRVAVAAFNRDITVHPVRAWLLPADQLRPTDRFALFGNGQPLDPQAAEDLEAVYRTYPGAFSPGFDIKAVLERGQDYAVSYMTTCTTFQVYKDCQATTLTLGRETSALYNGAIAHVKENAAAGNPDAAAAVSMLTANAEKRKGQSKAQGALWERAYAEGQGDRDAVAEGYEQAVQVIAELRQTVAALRHELALRGAACRRSRRAPPGRPAPGPRSSCSAPSGGSPRRAADPS
jgi:hypothetical protein